MNGQYKKGDRVAINGQFAVVHSFREIEDMPVIVIVYDCGTRKSYMLDTFKAELLQETT